MVWPTFVISVAFASPTGAPRIVNGSPEPGFPSVVALGVPPLAVCTGNLITPRIVLTAAHCSGELPLEFVVQFGGAIFGSSAREPDAFIRLSQAFLHPDYVPLQGNVTLGEFDLALAVLVEDAPVRPTRVRWEPPTAGDVGRTLVSVGFGRDEAGASGVKRSAPLVLSELDPMFLISESDDNEGGANICSGDSGGPQFAFDGDEHIQWAVHSWGDTACARVSGSTRVDVATTWIVDRIEEVHGTRDLCLVNGRYGDGTCDWDCARFDPDCPGGVARAPVEAPRSCSSIGPLNNYCAGLGATLLGAIASGLGRRRRDTGR